MPHSQDNVNSHHRHWRDAEFLFQKCRWANADQLYGLSAECAAKALMPLLSLTVTYIHLDVLWTGFAQAATAAQGRLGARFAHFLPAGAPFLGWSIQNRYAHECHFSKTVVKPYRVAAGKIHMMLQVAQQDGVL